MMPVRNEALTIRAAILSLLDFADEVVVVNNLSTDESAEIAAKVSPKVKVLDYPHVLVNPQTVPENDPRSVVALRNFALAACSHDWIIKSDGDMVWTPEGVEVLAILRKAGFLEKMPWLGLGGAELTSPTTQTANWTGEEPRIFNRRLDGGIQHFRHSCGFFEILWNPKWGDYNRVGWGPHYRKVAGPFWLHYGWVCAADPGRAERHLPQEVFTGTHHPEIVKHLDEIFPVTQ
jgi:glycosyltransferase involved in cell wall biosynthesis